ncbi:hypothetical protein DOPI104051_08040 [Dolosigranulum pigrum]|uniref:Uncharacterized protein n=1 Tax=Dolosigranulum pigrum ATCC 51524 TaxID=883103 RepID=H3ND01_9LACT|nr:hypothetical protein HMPREF9703_00432 [Dolosigranulum pigrum ATCC 51524]
MLQFLITTIKNYVVTLGSILGTLTGVTGVYEHCLR